MITAIIPTRNRPGMLADALTTLVTQVEPPPGFEVLVIDDGSEPPLDEVVARFADATIPIRGVRQDPAGLNVARNHGAEEARGDVLAYLDDDTFVDPHWARAIARAFDTWQCDGLGGRIVLELEGPAPRWLTPPLRSYLSELDRGDEPHWLPPGVTPWGANCAVTREGFERADRFALDLDRIGASLVSNGDKEFFERLTAAGGRIAYWPAAQVRHRVPPARLTSEFFRRRARAQGVSDVLTEAREAQHGIRPATAIAREVVRAARAAPILVKNLPHTRSVEPARLWLAYCGGRVSTILEGRRGA